MIDCRSHLWTRWNDRHLLLHPQRVRSALFFFLSLALTLLPPNSLGGDLALEDAKFAAYLEANGWHGDVGAPEPIDELTVEEKAAL